MGVMYQVRGEQPPAETPVSGWAYCVSSHQKFGPMEDSTFVGKMGKTSAGDPNARLIHIERHEMLLHFPRLAGAPEAAWRLKVLALWKTDHISRLENALLGVAAPGYLRGETFMVRDWPEALKLFERARVAVDGAPDPARLYAELAARLSWVPGMGLAKGKKK